MAETGNKSFLISEIETQINLGNAQYLLSGGGIGASPGEVMLEFDITQKNLL